MAHLLVAGIINTCVLPGVSIIMMISFQLGVELFISCYALHTGFLPFLVIKFFIHRSWQGVCSNSFQAQESDDHSCHGSYYQSIVGISWYCLLHCQYKWVLEFGVGVIENVLIPVLPVLTIPLLISRDQSILHFLSYFFFPAILFFPTYYAQNFAHQKFNLLVQNTIVATHQFNIIVNSNLIICYIEASI